MYHSSLTYVSLYKRMNIPPKPREDTSCCGEGGDRLSPGESGRISLINFRGHTFRFNATYVSEPSPHFRGTGGSLRLGSPTAASQSLIGDKDAPQAKDSVGAQRSGLTCRGDTERGLGSEKVLQYVRVARLAGPRSCS